MTNNWKKAPPELTARFTSLLPPHPDVTVRQMFGYAAAFVRGNFWTGLFEDSVVVRLPDGLHARFPAVAGAPAFDPMGGRPMRGWFVIPPAISGDDAALGRFMRETLDAVLALPPKASKTKAAKKPGAPARTAKKQIARRPTKKKTAKKKAATKKGGASFSSTR